MGEKKILLAMVLSLLCLVLQQPAMPVPDDVRADFAGDRKLELQFAGQQVLVTVAEAQFLAISHAGLCHERCIQ